MTITYRTLLSVFIGTTSLVSFNGYGQGKWNLQKNKDGIRISTRNSAASSFNDVLVEVDLPGSAEDVVAAVMKVENYQDWAYATKNSAAVSRSGDSSLIYYSQIVAPWPISNRDLYAAINVHRDSVSKRTKITCTGVPAYGAVRDHLVRIPFSNGAWQLTPLGADRVHLEYILQINPGGNVPAWVLNLFVTKGPYETFSHLRSMLSQSKTRGTAAATDKKTLRQ